MQFLAGRYGGCMKEPEHPALQSYDIIGDIHGYASILEKLLRKLGYNESSGSWRHPGGRKVLFLGDFIDRGPEIRRTLEIARAMTRGGAAVAVMGNHEYNALLYHTKSADGAWLRPHSAKNVRQHAVTLAQFWDARDEWEECLAWFTTLPLWLDLGGVRAVHANWSDRLVAAHPEWRNLDPDLLRRSTKRDSAEFEHCEVLLKGAEIALPAGSYFTDKENTVRSKIRLKWWLAARGLTYRQLCMPESDTVPETPIPPSVENLCGGYAPEAPPLFFGHYWLPFETGEKLIAPNVACLDFSVAKDGPLTAYRWDGEQILDERKLVFAWDKSHP